VRKHGDPRHSPVLVQELLTRPDAGTLTIWMLLLRVAMDIAVHCVQLRKGTHSFAGNGVRVNNVQ